MSYTEFYCQSGGSKLNAGSTTSNTAAYTSTNGNWNGTTTFTPTDGSNPSVSVSVGDFASVYLDAATVGVYIARVTSVTNAVNGAIGLSGTAKAGTPPTSGATGRSIKVGGAFKGPSGTDMWPFGIGNLNALTNASGDLVRINLKNDATYSVTGNVNMFSGPIKIQGYSSTLGDGGKAIIDAGTSNVTIVTISTNVILIDIIAQNNSAAGTVDAIAVTLNCLLIRCVANNVGGNGFNSGSSANIFVECEAYSCNKANTNGSGGFRFSSSQIFLNCISHDNTGSNNDGFTCIADAALISLINCIADSNGRNGIGGAIGNNWLVHQCDLYNNGGDGLHNSQTTANTVGTNVRNCNFVKNGGYGINSALTTGRWNGIMDNCGFGSGTQANGLGQTNGTDNIVINGSITYPVDVTPWVDPVNGDFRINLPEANGTGRGAFTQTAAGYGNANMKAYPDVGAVQSKTGPGGTFGKEVSYGFAQ